MLRLFCLKIEEEDCYVLFFWSFLSNLRHFKRQDSRRAYTATIPSQSFTLPLYTLDYGFSLNKLTFGYFKSAFATRDVGAALWSLNITKTLHVLFFWPLLPISWMPQKLKRHCDVAGALLFWTIDKRSKRQRDAKDVLFSDSSLQISIALLYISKLWQQLAMWVWLFCLKIQEETYDVLFP